MTDENSSPFGKNAPNLFNELEATMKGLKDKGYSAPVIDKGIAEAKSRLEEGKAAEAEQKYTETKLLTERAEASISGGASCLEASFDTVGLFGAAPVSWLCDPPMACVLAAVRIPNAALCDCLVRGTWRRSHRTIWSLHSYPGKRFRSKIRTVVCLQARHGPDSRLVCISRNFVGFIAAQGNE